MSREIRHVPANWEHPMHLNIWRGLVYRPMGNEDYQDAVRDWRKELRRWMNGYKNWQRGRVYTYVNFVTDNNDFRKDWVSIKDLQERVLKGIYAERKKHGYGSTYEEESEKKIKSGTYRYSDYEGNIPSPPNPEDYMPTGVWYQLYETVSEGTPLSPPFATSEELFSWLVTHKDFSGEQWTAEQAESILENEWSPSGIFVNGEWKFGAEAAGA